VSEKRRGLGRGLGALIPSGAAPVTRPAGDRPVDVFFPDRDMEGPDGHGPAGGERELATSAVGTGPAAGTHGHVATVATRPGGSTASLPTTTRPTSRLAPSTPVRPAPAVPAPGIPPAVAPTPARANGAGTPGPAPAVGPSRSDVVTAAAADDGSDLVPVPGVYFAEIPVSSIRPNPKQPRQVFDEEAHAELVQSVKEIGVLQPVVVRRVQDGDENDAQFELIMGERRLRACKDAGLDRIPAIVRDTQDDALLRDALLENLHRAQLNPLEEAAAYQQLLDDFGCTHEELATRIGRSRPQISNTLRLLKLPPLVQRRVAAGVLSAGHARALLGLEDHAAMERLAQRIVAEGLSVRAVEEIVALGDGPVAKAPRRRPRAGAHTSELDDLAARLGDRLDTKVAIALGRNKGRVSIDFASVEDLNRIIGLLSPEVRGVFHA
jgi:ParB family chromosome partitioning protein